MSQASAKDQGFSLRGIGGTHVVLLGMNLDKAACKGLKGFAIHRTDHTEEEAYWLEGMKTFAETDPGFPPGSRHKTKDHPIQDFMWSDYSAKPGHSYTYRVLALKGSPAELETFREVSVDIDTESPEGGDHNVFFNRGATATQEYARRFGNRKPGTQGGDADPAWKWLSRGAYEAILDFIGRARSTDWGLRVSAYEFRQAGVAQAFREACDRNVDVRILYDAGKEFPRDENRAAVAAAGIEAVCTERIPRPAALSHNKFIVLLQGKKPKSVLLGSTNFSDGGIFGQSNVVHIIDNEDVAAAYLAYWNALATNPERKMLAPQLTEACAIPGEDEDGTIGVFSPRNELDALDFYAGFAGKTKDALFMTFAFGMHDLFSAVYKNGTAPLRYAMFETPLGPGVRKEKRAAALQAFTDLRKMPENQFAVGSHVSINSLDRWLDEELTGLNTHVKYVHTKYMLIDPLGKRPIVVTGSANFSAASSNKNDENMVVIRGNRRVADIYLGEYMRLWEHYAFREWLTRAKKPAVALREPWHLDSTDRWWGRHFGDTTLSRKREYFAV